MPVWRGAEPTSVEVVDPWDDVRLRHRQSRGRATLTLHRVAATPTTGSNVAASLAETGDGGLSLKQRAAGAGPLVAGHVVNDSYSYALQTLLPAIIPTLGLTLGQAGGLVSIWQLTASLVQPVVGHLADRSPLRWPAWAGVVLSGAAAALLGLAPSYGVLVALVIVGGVGSAIFHPVSAAMAVALAPARARGRWMGLYVTAGNYGLALGPLMIGPLLESRGPGGTWPIVAPALVVAAVVALLAPRRSRPGAAAPPLRQTLHAHRRALWSLILVVSLRAWAGTATVTFIPLLARLRGLSLGDSAQALGVYLLAGATGGLVAGFAADRWGRDRVLAGALLASVPFGLVVALGGQTGLPFLAAAAGTGFFLNGAFVVLTIRGQESMPGSAGMVAGVTLGLSSGLGGLAVTPLALLSERAGVPAAAAIAALLPATAALTMRLMPPLPARAPG